MLGNLLDFSERDQELYDPMADFPNDHNSNFYNIEFKDKYDRSFQIEYYTGVRYFDLETIFSDIPELMALYKNCTPDIDLILKKMFELLNDPELEMKPDEMSYLNKEEFITLIKKECGALENG